MLNRQVVDVDKGRKMTTLAGKTVWITGASSGIGEALAVAASKRGARLVLTSRRAGELERVRSRCINPAQVAVLPLDLTAFDAAAAVEQAERFFGAVDVLVNNAGWSQRGTVADTAVDVYRRLFELDFFAPLALTKAVLPGMRRRGIGHVVMIGSVVSKVATPTRSGYAAAKHALYAFTDAARAELWRDNIRFTLVMPGYVHTQVSINALTASGGKHGRMDEATAKGMPPERCAERVWRAVEKNRDEVLIAGFEGVEVYLERFLPALVRFVLKRANVT
jgi:short-subunit dehydrogenase